MFGNPPDKYNCRNLVQQFGKMGQSVQRIWGPFPFNVPFGVFRRDSTRTWIRSWMHAAACGGLQGKSVAKAIDQLHLDFEKGGSILLSLDFKKCFACIHPELGLKSSTWVAAPQCWACSLQFGSKIDGSHTMGKACRVPSTCALHYHKVTRPVRLLCWLWWRDWLA